MWARKVNVVCRDIDKMSDISEGSNILKCFENIPTKRFIIERPHTSLLGV